MSPALALLGGLLAVMEFGPLNQWMNSYWGGSLTAAAGCLVFGALPRLRTGWRLRDGVILGVGMAIHLDVYKRQDLPVTIIRLFGLQPDAAMTGRYIYK